MKTDLTYSEQGLFTAFFPVSKAGEDAWQEIAKQTGGTGKFYTVQLPAVKASLKAAGYIVKPAPKLSKKQSEAEIDAIMAEIEEMERAGLL